MNDRAMKGLTPPPSSRRELERTLRELKHDPPMTPERLEAFNNQIEQAFPGGFDRRDEANAIIAMSVRNGPIENLHAGKHSPLLEDESLSRLTDAEIKAIMVYATRMVTFMLWLRDEAPDVYRRYVQACGIRYCRAWERGG
jgi:hypothetical protein